LQRYGRLKQYLIYSHAQFWFWGQDLEHHKAKTFLAYGFEQFPPPPGVTGRSMYLLRLSETRFLCLWAYGFLIGEVGKRGLFVRRGSFRLEITREIFSKFPTEHLTSENLLLSRAKGDLRLARLWHDYRSSLISTVFHYEKWIQEKMGLKYRQHCLDRWRNKDFKLENAFPILNELSIDLR
jgi:hypothetical protein